MSVNLNTRGREEKSCCALLKVECEMLPVQVVVRIAIISADLYKKN